MNVATLNPVSFVSEQRINQLWEKHYNHCCGKNKEKKERGLNSEWVKASCYSVNEEEASQLLGYRAKSAGIMIEGANAQSQYRPDKPWSDKQGKRAPKYRTATGDEYDAMLPKHPTDKYFWNDFDALKERCYKINGIPMILVTEGGFKAISLCSYGLPAIALLGVEMGLTPSSADPQGRRYLVKTLERLARAGFGFILAFDADTYYKKEVLQALIKLARQLQKFKVPVYSLPPWDEQEGKGIDDFIQNKGIEAFREELLSQTYCFEEWFNKYGAEAFYTKGDRKIPKADIVGKELAEQYNQRWIYCDQLGSWLAYSIELEGIWSLVSEKYMAAEIDRILEARNIEGYGSHSYIKNIIASLERRLYLKNWNEKSSTQWLPFPNGVLELSTGKLHEHSPGFRFTWQLPRDYVIVQSGWNAQ